VFDVTVVHIKALLLFTGKHATVNSVTSESTLLYFINSVMSTNEVLVYKSNIVDGGNGAM